MTGRISWPLGPTGKIFLARGKKKFDNPALEQANRKDQVIGTKWNDQLMLCFHYVNVLDVT
jgi:hypothetical protein